MTTLVFLPGLASDRAMWAAQLAAFDGLLPTVCSDVHFRAESLPAMAAQLLAELPGPLVLCGASMGGMVALHAALAAPARVVGLGLFGTSARAESPDIAARRAAAFRMIEAGHFEDMIQTNVPFAFHLSRLDETALLNDYLEMLRRAGPAELMRQNRAIADREDLRPRLGGIGCPALVLCGDEDRVTTTEASRELARLLPAAELEWLADCGHMLTMERPAEVNASLRRWLARHVTG